VPFYSVICKNQVTLQLAHKKERGTRANFRRQSNQKAILLYILITQRHNYFSRLSSAIF